MNYMVPSEKKLVNEKDVLSTPNPNLGKKIPREIVKRIIMFYKSDNINCCMQGKKDSVSMMINGKKERVEKRLIVCSLKEAYLKFKENSDLKLGFSICITAPEKCLPSWWEWNAQCLCIHYTPKREIDEGRLKHQQLHCSTAIFTILV